MRRIITYIIIATALVQEAYSQKISTHYVDGEVYIKVKDSKSVSPSVNGEVKLATELPFLSRLGGRFSFTSLRRAFYFATSQRLQRVYRVKITEPNRIKELMASIANDPDVEYVEMVPLNRRVLTPNDPSFGTQYHLAKIQAPQAWDVTTGVNDVVVAVVDDAVQTTHPDLSSNCVAGYDVADNDNNPNPPNTNFDHGTHVAGIVGAVTGNSIGIASAGFNKVKIMGVKTTGDAQDPSYIYYGYEGVTWAANNGAKVINMSWGGGAFSQTGQDVMNAAAAQGAVLVAAAGNSNITTPFYPAAYTHVIAVASTTSSDQKSSFSNFGSYIDIAAPGSSILSTLPFGTYGTFSGTSMASPLTASVCGFLLSINNTLTASQVEQIIKSTADNVDAQNPTFVGQLGAGRINLLKAVSCQNNIFTASIAAVGSSAICSGQSVLLTANLSGSGTTTYQWKKGDANVGTNSPTFMASDTGAYRVIATRGSCTITTNPLSVTSNPLITSSPTVTGQSICPGGTLTNPLQVAGANCVLGGPGTFSYSGGTVGYDDGNATGPNPTANVIGLGGNITHVSVSITWEKKNQSNINSCGLTHLGGFPWNSEVSFQLKSPDGTTITLLFAGTYNSSNYGGVVTTVFQTGGMSILTGSTPSSGTFAPAQSLLAFNGLAPTGTWTLIPNDNAAIDPLCVQGFSVTITTDAVPAPPSYNWWSAATGGILLGTGPTHTPLPMPAYTQAYYAEAQCAYACPSVRVPATLTINGPAIVAFPITFGGFSLQTVNELIITKGTTLQTLPTGEYQLQNLNTNQSIIISDRPPLVEPVTICAGQSLLLLAPNCTGTATWSNGMIGTGIIVTPNATTNYTTGCEVSPCPYSYSAPFTVWLNPITATVASPVPSNALQTFRATTLTAQNTISSTAKINYIGGQQVVLLPGFTANAGSVVKAEIGGCN